MVNARLTIPLLFTLLAAGLTAATASLTGCGGGGSGGSGGGGGGTSNGCFDYTSFKGDTPAVTFKADVLPIFRNSCGLSTSCHGSTTAVGAQHFLGPSKSAPDPTADQIQAIFDQSVGKPAVEEPDMSVIKASDPANSFLMYKLDGLSCSKLKCTSDKSCGVTMPQSAPLLAQTDRDTIRRWISQGAKND